MEPEKCSWNLVPLLSALGIRLRECGGSRQWGGSCSAAGEEGLCVDEAPLKSRETLSRGVSQQVAWGSQTSATSLSHTPLHWSERLLTGARRLQCRLGNRTKHSPGRQHAQRPLAVTPARFSSAGHTSGSLSHFLLLTCVHRFDCKGPLLHFTVTWGSRWG